MFKDFVVAQLNLMETTRPFMSKFLLTNGTPLWNLSRTREIDPNKLLVVPVLHPTEQKINAVMAFTGTSTHTHYSLIKLGENYEEFVIAEDFLGLTNQEAFETIHPNINKKYYPSKTEQGKINEKYIYPNISCWNVYTGGPGLQETYSYTFCISNGSWYMATNILPTISWPVVFYGGGGGTNPNDPPPAEPPSGSSEIPKTQLKPIRNTLQKVNCPNRQILIDSLWNSVTFYYWPDMSDNGGYDRSNEWIFFKNTNPTNSTLLHEMFHRFQHSVSGDNYPKKGSLGYVNFEFETWLYVDIWARQNGGWTYNNHQSWTYNRNVPANIYRNYVNWIDQLIMNPDLLHNNGDYHIWLNRFNQYMPQYSSPIDPYYNIPRNIINLYTSCNIIN